MGPKRLLGCPFIPGSITGEVLVPELVGLLESSPFSSLVGSSPSSVVSSSGIFFAILKEAACPWVEAEDCSPNQVDYFSGIIHSLEYD